MTAQSILEQKGIESHEASAIIFNKLDILVREEFGVSECPIHLWDVYCLGDAGEDEVLEAASTGADIIDQYNDTYALFDDMTVELERLASLYEA